MRRPDHGGVWLYINARVSGSVLRVSQLTSSWDNSQMCMYTVYGMLIISIYTSVGNTNKLIEVGTAV